MFPYRDNLIARGRSYGVIVLIGVLAAVNIPLFLTGLLSDAIVRLGFIPILFAIKPWPNAHTLITSEFLHGDIFHLVGNCLFLWVFGRSLEQLFGTWRYLAAFPFLGFAGLLAHWAIYPGSPSPVIGASGAIAFMMGGYLVLFPAARMRMILFVWYFWKRFTAPAWMFLIYWGGLQLLSLAIGSAEDRVAYAVHAGSFFAGILAAMVWKTSYPFAEEELSAFTEQSFS